jgi:hypothetical protein
LANAGPTNTFTSVAANPPTPGGGTIHVGTYFETSDVDYTGPGGAHGPGIGTRSSVLQVTSSSGGFTFQFVTSTDGAPNDYQTWTVVVGTTDMLYTATCGVTPIGFSMSLQYTATSTTLSIYRATAIETYTLQP